MKKRYGNLEKFTIFVALFIVCLAPFLIRRVYDGGRNIHGLQYNRTLNHSAEDDWQLNKNLGTKFGKDFPSHKKKGDKGNQPDLSNSGDEHRNEGVGGHKAGESVTAAMTTIPPNKAPEGGTHGTTTRKTEPSSTKKYLETTVKPKDPDNKGTRKASVDVEVKKVELVVIYESLCPYSRRLVYSQLRPTYTQLAPYINLTLLPFGKAHVRTERDGAGRNITKISCQHGESECVGNKIETCVLRVVKQTVTAVQIVACMSENSSPHTAGEKCATAFGVKWSLIDTCFKEHGEEYQLQVAAMTWKYKSEVTRVPIVVMNGKQGNYVNYHAQNDMIVIVCNEIKALGNEEPKVCHHERSQRRRRKR
ncbi:gamma-interferon-inducible lysosomal thiol reductase-like [Ixodes scapularis]|uniref:gamma-interferon-inducible lysosomal thiol reductase-like n=1 Tax=Ixodes scapularis TaxID=6945 RepID=UPI001AA006E5|nr:gamma-interferon-inducible lysosomal thiol reductase-like [Ixodes scapularis]